MKCVKILGDGKRIIQMDLKIKVFLGGCVLGISPFFLEGESVGRFKKE